MVFAVVGEVCGDEPLPRRLLGRPAPPSSPFDDPQFPKRNWRVVGRWKIGGEFLVVLGASELDALDRTPSALQILTRKDVKAVQSIWLERWSPGSPWEFPCWEPQRRLPLWRLRYGRTARGRRWRSVLDFFLSRRRRRYRKGA